MIHLFTAIFAKCDEAEIRQRFTGNTEETILRLQSVAEQQRQLQFVPQDPKEMSIFHPYRMENCWLDFDARNKFTVAVVACKIVSLLFTALWEAAN